MILPLRPQSRSLAYLPHVDGLRALAVALVVVFHAWPGALPGGFIGVDVFFVISGFIITRQISVEMEEERFSFAAFLGRRVRRLVPAAFVCCLLVTFTAFVVLMPDALVVYSESLAAAWTMTANFYFYFNSGYFDAPSAEAPLLHMWSLAVEDQFYLTWPLLLLFLFRRAMTRERIIAVVLALAAVSLAHSQLSAESDPSLAFYLPSSRAFELLAGAALALGFPLLSAPGARTRTFLDATGLALVAVSAFALHSGVPFPGLAVLPTILGSVLLIGTGLYGPTPVSRLLSLEPVVLAGKTSYSIYLYHWPALAFATYGLGRAPDATEAALVVLASLGLAALSWAFVEQSFTRRLGLHDMAPLALFGRSAAVSAVFCVAAVTAVAGRGWPQRLDEPAYNVYQAASSGNPLRKLCDGYDLAFSRDRICNFGRHREDGQSYDIAVFGDSNADHFVPMIGRLAENAGLSGRQVTQSTCAALIGFDKPVRPQHAAETCTRYQEVILDFLDRNPGLKIAVLSSAWGDYTDTVANRVAGEARAGERLPFAHAVAETIDILRKRGIEVLVLGQVPHLDTFSLTCYVGAARNDSEEVDCTMPRAYANAELDTSEIVFRSAASADKDVEFISMRDILCTESLCSPFKDEVLLYRDRAHLNSVGSVHLARYASLPALDP